MHAFQHVSKRGITIVFSFIFFLLVILIFSNIATILWFPQKSAFLNAELSYHKNMLISNPALVVVVVELPQAPEDDPQKR